MANPLIERLKNMKKSFLKPLEKPQPTSVAFPEIDAILKEHENIIIGRTKSIEMADYILEHVDHIFSISVRYGSIRQFTRAIVPVAVPEFCRNTPYLVFVASKYTANFNDVLSNDHLEYTLRQELPDSPVVNTYPGMLRYNQLLSIVEDVVGMSIEEYTHGMFHYLEEYQSIG